MNNSTQSSDQVQRAAESVGDEKVVDFNVIDIEIDTQQLRELDPNHPPPADFDHAELLQQAIEAAEKLEQDQALDDLNQLIWPKLNR